MTDGELREKLSLSLRTGFIDAFTPSEEQLRPSLVLNHPPQTKVLASLVRELSVCASFAFSVAFVTRDGVASILSALYEARERGVSGKIITTDYLGFTDPEAIQFLRSYENIQVKVLSGKPFHAKGYVFFKDAEKTKATVIIGSANLTQEALVLTKGWNICLFALSSGELLHEIVGEFDQTWEASIDASDAWLTHYRRIYKTMHARMDGYYPLPEGAEEKGRDYVFRPNLMQQEALCSLAALRKNRARKALAVSATGKRPYENLIIRRFLDGRCPFPVASVEQEASENFKYPVGRLCVESAYEILSDRFFKESDRKKFGNMSYCRTESGVIGPTDEFLALLNNAEYRMQVSDLADFGLSQFGKRDLAGGRRENDFVLYDRYTRQDVCRLLCWTKDVASTIYGYKIDYERTKTCPIFVTYAKDSGRIDASIDYKDKFESEEVFSWFTRSGIRRDGKEPTAIRSGAVRNLLFVKKNDDEGGDFYYMGEMDYLSDEETTMEDGKGKAIAVVHMRFRMHDPVADPIYAYLCDGTTWDAKRSVPARGMVG